MAAYVVSTPKNPAFEGKVCGIRFSNGMAVVSKETLNPHLGYTVEQVVHLMEKDFGYDVRPLGTDAVLPVAPVFKPAQVQAEPTPVVADVSKVFTEELAKPKSKQKRVTRRKGAEVKEPAPSQ